ncbi:MAG TPA: PspC domain-containing protein [Mariniphaga anaerophila]|jgi:phage shock protein C|uniref:PspC domain-containing protein n=1 Tax=Mariniphaga anaerophila TaxID=1484053 RepID=A0A831LJ45_9BACT|nr:PspC domain-containing protein [Mariniphaga anaerophila]
METTSQPKKLYRSRDRILGGVLAGFAEYIYADKTVVRLLYALVSILSAGFPGLLIYIIAWIVIPERPLEH